MNLRFHGLGREMENERLVVQAAQTGELSSAIGWIIGIVTSVFSVLLSLIWKKHNEEIVNLKEAFSKIDTALGKKVDSDLFNKTEDRLRTGMIDLHSKIETSSSEIHRRIDQAERDASQRHIDLLNALRERR